MMDDSGHREREHFFGSAKVIAGMTVLSRIAGLVRAMAIAGFGANKFTDAFALAWQIPNLLRRLFAEGALTAAFVPTFTELLEDRHNGQARASALLANATGLLALLMAGIYALTQAGLVVWAIGWPGAPDRQLMVLLTSLMLPFMVTICLLALASAALNCRGHFLYPAATPIILNVIIIAVAYAVRHAMRDLTGQLEAVAVSVSIAGMVQLAGVFWLLRRSGFGLRWKLRPIEPGIRSIARLMAPVLMGLGFLQLSELFQSGMAWVLRYSPQDPTLNILGWKMTKPLEYGVLAQIGNARYLYQFPMGVLAISLGVAVFPLLSRYAARGDMPNFRASINRALRLSFMEGMATGVGLLILAGPITTLLFLTGEYTAQDVAVTKFVTQTYVLGMWAYCTYQIIVRAFYALKDTTTPLKVSCILAVVNLVTIGLLIWAAPQFGPGAFGASTALTFGINAVVLILLLRKRVGLLGGRKLLKSFARTLAACAVMAVVLVWLLMELQQQPLTLWPGMSIQPMLGYSPPHWGPRWTSLVVVAVTVPVGAIVFIAAAWLMRAPELGELFGAVRQKIARNVQEEGPGNRD